MAAASIRLIVFPAQNGVLEYPILFSQYAFPVVSRGYH